MISWIAISDASRLVSQPKDIEDGSVAADESMNIKSESRSLAPIAPISTRQARSLFRGGSGRRIAGRMDPVA
jgi:hypothetical protein